MGRISMLVVLFAGGTNAVTTCYQMVCGYHCEVPIPTDRLCATDTEMQLVINTFASSCGGSGSTCGCDPVMWAPSPAGSGPGSCNDPPWVSSGVEFFQGLTLDTVTCCAPGYTGFPSCTTASGFPTTTDLGCSYGSSGFVGSSGDPHLVFAKGGVADFRGLNRRIFAFLSAPDVQVNVMTEDRDFQRWGGQIVHGSFITRLFLKLRSKITGAIVRVEVRANQYSSFRRFGNDTDLAYANRTRIESGDGISVLQFSGGRFIAQAAGWRILVNHRRLRKPLLGSKSGEDPQRWFLDLKLSVLDGDEKASAQYGHSSIGRIAPHGIIGQSFDGSQIAVSGKLDKYGDTAEFTTSAQAEGAIEAKHTDYIMPAPFATEFMFGRFDAKDPIAARNISVLTGVKTAAKVGAIAGSDELHGVEPAQA